MHDAEAGHSFGAAVHCVSCFGRWPHSGKGLGLGTASGPKRLYPFWSVEAWIWDFCGRLLKGAFKTLGKKT